MQTFLPYPDFVESAKCLDYRRLGKQRLEVRQVLDSISGKIKGWVNHPCATMWRDNTDALVEYGVAICQEWKRRGYKDKMEEDILAHRSGKPVTYPWWLGDEDFHISHQSNLVKKKPEYYGPMFPEIEPNLLYLWPTEDHQYRVIPPKN